MVSGVQATPNVDANFDGLTNGSDFLFWQRNFSSTASTNLVTLIPEPLSEALLLIVGLALALLRRPGVNVPAFMANPQSKGASGVAGTGLFR